MTLTDQQVETLLRPIKPGRVMVAQGQSHIPAYDVIAHLTRVFGFAGWDKEIRSIDLVEERNDVPGKNGWYVTYRCLMRLTVRDPEGNVVKVIEDGATGSAQNMPGLGDAHDFAYKNAISYALKRCAKDLGDQFGLSLYNKGSKGLLVGTTLVGRGSTPAVDVESHAPVPLSLGNDERQVDHETGEILSTEPAPVDEVADTAAPDEGGDTPPPSSEVDHAGTGAVDRPPPATNHMTANQNRMLHALLNGAGVTTDADRHEYATKVLGRPVGSYSDLSKADASKLIDALKVKEGVSA